METIVIAPPTLPSFKLIEHGSWAAVVWRDVAVAWLQEVRQPMESTLRLTTETTQDWPGDVAMAQLCGHADRQDASRNR